VITFLHIFSAVKWRKKNKLGVPIIYEPFYKCILCCGCRNNERVLDQPVVYPCWCHNGEAHLGLPEAQKCAKDWISPIQEKLHAHWKITGSLHFPQGTTKPFAPARKGTAYIIKLNKPIVVPVVISGFWRLLIKSCFKLKENYIVCNI